MNNVTQSKVKDISQQKEGTGKGALALFCCTLFILFQIHISFDLLPRTPLPDTQLVVLPNQKLVLENVGKQKTIWNLNFDHSPETHQLTPFFFLPVAINYCDKSLLMSVSGIGPGLAESILQKRKEIGTFSAPEDLLQIKGIGSVRLHKFTPSFSFSKDHD